ncbi:MAG: hypothetical protein RIG84_17095 [Roseovarius sp.]
MTSSANPGGPAQSHRFVLVYRSETREIEGAATIWRGWVQRVPNPRQREMDMQTDDRVDFRDLAEVPELLELLMTRAGTPEEAKPSTRRRRP